MTKQEFIERIGIQCSDAIYAKYNRIYMESELDKDAFCETLPKQQIAWEMQWEIIELKKELEEMKRQRDEAYGHCQMWREENKKLTATIKAIAEIAKA